ncbi:MAG TPA: NADH-quinone oxidoreductase subunit C, partial [Lysobacter sp.]|nr:NADH-quinone oxidoreductase subunit C [Lysobacter sp.]
MTSPMPLADLDITWTPMHGALQAIRAAVSSTQLLSLCRGVRDGGGQLVSLWGEDGRDGLRLCVVLESGDQLLVLEHELPSEAPTYPTLSEIFPSAARLQRAAQDLVGLHALGGDDRPWLRHAAWPRDAFPLRTGPIDPA